MKEKQKLTIWNKQFTCAVAANILLSFSLQTVNPLISTYAKFIGAGAVIVGLVSGLYFGVAVAMRPFSGPIITKYDKRKIMIAAYVLGAITGIIYAFSRTITIFVIARVLHGIQFAFLGSLSLTLASDSLPKEKLGTGIGIFGAGYALATAIAPSMGIAIRNWASSMWGESAGFMILFFVSAGFTMLGLIPVLMLKPSKLDKDVLASFGAWYKNIVAKEALYPAGQMLLVSMSQNMIATFLVPYAASKNIENIGLYFTVSALFLLVSRLFSGRLIDKYGINKVYLPSLILYITTFFLVALGNKLWVLLLGAAIGAFGSGTLNPAIMTLCIRSVPVEKRGVASNTQYIGMDFGFFIGPTLGGFLNAHFGYSCMYLIGAIPLVLTGVLFYISWNSMKDRLY